MLAKRGEQRLHSLGQIDSLLMSLEGMLRSTCAPLDELFGLLSCEAAYRDLPFLADCGAPGGEISGVFVRAVSESAPALALTDGDVDILSHFGGRLGKTDLEGQLSLIRLCRRRLQEQLVAAAEEQAKTGKLYRQLGVLAGAALVVMLV